MKRRSAIKNLGMAFGYTVATPTLLGLVQSCKEKAFTLEWNPSYFDKENGFALTQMIDVILPKTDTPSATEVNVHIFIDEYAKSVLPKEQQTFLKVLMNKFMNKVLSDSGKESLTDLKGADFEPALNTYLTKRSDEEEMIQEKAVESYMKSIMHNESTELDNDVACYAFADNIRSMATWAYKSSEYIGEEVLAYLPLPGEYIACGDVNELTQGKAWSL